MSEVDRRLAERLMTAASVTEIITTLVTEREPYTFGALVADLTERRDRLVDGGRPAEARLAALVLRHVMEQRPVIERTAARNARSTDDLDLRRELTEQDDRRHVLETSIGELARRDQVDEALALVRQADALPLRPEHYADAAAARHMLADALRGFGRSAEALEILVYRSADGPPPGLLLDRPQGLYAAARFSNMEGLLHEDVGSYELGRACYAASAQFAREAGHEGMAFEALTNFAASYSKSGRPRTAVREFRRLLQRATDAGNPGQIVASLNNIAGMSDAATARACYTRVLEICGEYGATGISHAIAMFGLGDLAADEGRYQDAANAYLNAYRVGEGSDGRTRSFVRRSLADRYERGNEVTDLLSHHPTAFEGLIINGGAQGVISFTLGEARLKRARGDRAGAEDDLRGVLHSRIHERGQGRQDALRVALDLAELLAEEPAGRQEAFDLLWRSRGELLEATDRAAVVRTHHRVWERLIALLAEHGDRLLLPGGASPVELAFDLHEEAKSDDPVSFAALRERLAGENEAAFVSFLCGADATAVFVFVPATGHLAMWSVPIGRARIAEAATRLERTFNGAPDDFPPLAPLHPRRPWRRDLAFLEDLSALLEPWIDTVAGRDLLLVAPHGPLLRLPLAALPTPDGGPLALSHALVYVLSATAVVRSGSAAPEPGDGPVLCAGVAAREDLVPELLERDGELFDGTGREVRELTGTEATREAILAALREARTAHLTCHGYFDSREHLDSGLLVAHAGSRPTRHPSAQPVHIRHDHLLTPRDLAAAHVQLELMTLRACSAGAQDTETAEDVTGLAQALLTAGVRTVIAPLWDVAEESSRLLLAATYRGQAQPLWRSLWTAQRAMIENPARPWHAHPYHWAALTLFGSWSPS
ncbi:CHAT domain-containing protein [Actinomadura meyerae]|uniref:CHAT domain-containing protein n=1 Tax=Actinomadura meyerae TaxID=240840 RepID=A0A239NGK5_9ACTN|nr:CHAT domain-containing protein [Actinomadura meyerae]SNT53910.1 CHAT domain-containing protein [Actinomadura meyerae]